jgi:hypothetical protein
MIAELDSYFYEGIMKEIRNMKDDAYSVISDAVDKYNRNLDSDSVREIKKAIDDYERAFERNEKTKEYLNNVQALEAGVELEFGMELKSKQDLSRIGIDEIVGRKIKVDSTEYDMINSSKIKCLVKPGSKIQVAIRYIPVTPIVSGKNEKTVLSRVFNISEVDFIFSVLTDAKEYDVIGKITADKSFLKIAK